MIKRSIKWDDLPLFASDAEIGTALLGPERAGEFRQRAALLEGRGLPKIDPQWGGRYTPAVRRFFDVDYGLSDAKPRNPGGVERADQWKRTG